jgi:glycosyltransferase involved in cell wall biosynthesis
MIIYSFIDYPLDLIGGAQGSAKSIAEGLLNKGIMVRIVTPRLIVRESRQNLDIIEYEFIKSRLGLIRKILIYDRLLKFYKINFVHAHFPISAIALCILKLNPRHRDLKVIFTDHGLYNQYSKFTKILMRFVSQKSEAVITTTCLNQEEWKKLGNSPVFLIPNSVNYEFTEILKDKVVKIPKIIEDSISLGFAGTFTPIKNWPLVIEIIKELNKLRVNYKINIAIHFSPTDKTKVSEFLDKLKVICPVHNLKIEFNNNQEKMIDFYTRTNIFILTSISESFGKTAIEAMSTGCIVIGTNYGGLSEVIGRKDLLFNLDESSKIAKTIELYYKKPSFYKRDSAYFYNRFTNYFTVEKSILSHIELYNNFYFDNIEYFNK